MITFRKLKDTIVGTIDGKPFNIPRTEQAVNILSSNPTSQDAWDFIKHNRNFIIAQANKYLAFNPITEQYFLELDGKRSKHPLPQALVDYIEESFDKDIDYMPIVKAWARLLGNPRYNEQMANYFVTYINTLYLDDEEYNRLVKEEELEPKIAEKLATYQDIAITQEGLLATYKVAEVVTWEYKMELQEDGRYIKVRNDKYKRIPAVIDPVTGEELEKEVFEKPEFLEDYVFTPAIIKNGDKFFSGDKIGYVYEIGKMQYLPKDAKRNLNHTFGGGGLYIGGLNYVKGYRSLGTHVLTCFVDPADILSFQSEGCAIRVDALMPNNVWEESIPLKGVYHSSDYGKMSQKRIDKLIEHAIENKYDIVEYQTNAQGDQSTYSGNYICSGEDFDIDDCPDPTY